MKNMKTTIAVFASALSLSAADINITGLLFTDAGINKEPISVSYNPQLALDWGAEGFTLATPNNGNLTLEMSFEGMSYNAADDADYPEWPGVTLFNGEPFALDFITLNPVEGITAIGAGGPLEFDRQIAGTTVEGWSVQVFVDTADGRFGTYGNPVPKRLLCPIPEPESMVFAAFMLLGLIAYRRWR